MDHTCRERRFKGFLPDVGLPSLFMQVTNCFTESVGDLQDDLSVPKHWKGGVHASTTPVWMSRCLHGYWDLDLQRQTSSKEKSQHLDGGTWRRRGGDVAQESDRSHTLSIDFFMVSEVGTSLVEFWDKILTILFEETEGGDRPATSGGKKHSCVSEKSPSFHHPIIIYYITKEVVIFARVIPNGSSIILIDPAGIIQIIVFCKALFPLKLRPFEKNYLAYYSFIAILMYINSKHNSIVTDIFCVKWQ